MSFQHPWQLRARFARRLSAMYGEEVPAYNTLVDVARTVWEENLPPTEKELALKGLAYFTYVLDQDALARVSFSAQDADLETLIDAGVTIPQPIVYEDFLPRSAAGIFQSNLTDEGPRDDAQLGTDYDITVLSEVVGRPVTDPHDLYRRQQDESVARLRERLRAVVTA